jgi:mRNA-decapping enzyme 1B
MELVLLIIFTLYSGPVIPLTFGCFSAKDCYLLSPVHSIFNFHFLCLNVHLWEQAAANVGGNSAVAVARQPIQPFGATPVAAHAATSITTTQSPGLHYLLPSQASSVSGRPADAHGGTGSIGRSTSLVYPSLFSPLTSSQTKMVHTNSAVPTAPPQHPRIAQQPQSAPLLQPFPLPTASSPPYGTPLLQPFPPPNPSPSLASAPVLSPALTRDKVRDALLRLVEVHCFVYCILLYNLNELFFFRLCGCAIV